MSGLYRWPSSSRSTTMAKNNGIGAVASRSVSGGRTASTARFSISRSRRGPASFCFGDFRLRFGANRSGTMSLTFQISTLIPMRRGCGALRDFSASARTNIGRRNVSRAGGDRGRSQVGFVAERRLRANSFDQKGSSYDRVGLWSRKERGIQICRTARHTRPYANELIVAHSTGPVTGGADWYLHKTDLDLCGTQMQRRPDPGLIAGKGTVSGPD